MRFAERADEAAGGVAVGAEVAERRSGAAVGRQVPFVDEGRGVRGVTGFVGPGSKPVPLSDEEAEAIISESRTSQKESTLKVGDAVDIVEGIFADYSGRLDEISPDGNEVTVIVSTVGRDMPIKLDMKQIRKKKDD